jgi:phosphoribosylanthranilate isomerase
MSPLERFLDPAFVSLKICGVTTCADAEALAELGVEAMGVNFWPRSKRYLAPGEAEWLRDFAGGVARVGVFVNEEPSLPLRLFREGLIDAVQAHGDESPEELRIYHEEGVPLIKGMGVKGADDLERAGDYRVAAMLLDAHAPGVYGGTGATFDWSAAVDFKKLHPGMALILAGGIVPGNARDAAMMVRPAALDVASGAEVSPGVKDMGKVAALLEALDF